MSHTDAPNMSHTDVFWIIFYKGHESSHNSYSKKKVEFGVNFFDYNICHILTINTSHTDIIQTHTKPTLKNTFTTKLAF